MSPPTGAETLQDNVAGEIQKVGAATSQLPSEEVEVEAGELGTSLEVTAEATVLNDAGVEVGARGVRMSACEAAVGGAIAWNVREDDRKAPEGVCIPLVERGSGLE